jgi:hypothetical protein
MVAACHSAEREFGGDSLAPRRTELASAVGRQLQQAAQCDGERRRIARRHDLAAPGEDHSTVSDISRDAWHPAGHRFADRIGKAFPPRRAKDGNVQGSHNCGRVGALAQQMHPSPEPGAADEVVNRQLAGVTPSPTNASLKSMPSAARMLAAAISEPWSFIG